MKIDKTNILSFFLFYYYWITSDIEKMCRIADNNPNNKTIIELTPVPFLVFTFIVFSSFPNLFMGALVVILFIISMLNITAVGKVEEAIFEIRMDKLRKQKEQQLREFNRVLDELHSRQRGQTSKNTTNAMNLLGLNHGFNKEDVKRAYRAMARKHHPDAGGSEENFKRLRKAYDHLMKQF